MRHYFASKAELLVFAMQHAGDRVERRIAGLPAGHSGLEHLSEVAVELLPLDDPRREEAKVYVAFLARATVDSDLAPVSEATWSRLHEPLAAHIAAAMRGGELSGDLDAEREANRLHALIDGLTLHLLTAPDAAPVRLARVAIDDHLDALRPTPARPRREGAPETRC